MRIRKLSIKNFRSLHNIEMDEIGDIAIIVGKNGSGKSNLLEALELFFHYFDAASDTPMETRPEMWFDKREEKPIEFDLTIELGDSDLAKIFTDSLGEKIGPVKKQSVGNTLRIKRRLVPNTWQQPHVGLDGVIRAHNSKIWLGISVDRRGDETVSEGTEQQMPQGVPRSQSEDVLKEEVKKELLLNITGLLRGSFRLIHSARESAERKPLPQRLHVLDSDTGQFLIRLSDSLGRSDETKWHQCTQDFRDFSGRTIGVRGGRLEFKVGDLILPVEFSGTGDQALLILWRYLCEGKPFYGIEEPEVRLHASYIRKMHSYLVEQSPNVQFFVATHSTIMLDQSSLENAWLFSLRGKETEVIRMTKKELPELLKELGVRPSDIFMAEKIIFVEGETEKILLPIIAQKTEIDISGVSLISIKGYGKAKYHLDLWCEVASAAGVDFYMLLDKSASKDAEKIIRDGKMGRDKVRLLDKPELEAEKECSLEDFYPKDKIVKVLEEHFSIQKPEIDPSKPVGSQIEKSVKEKYWKIELGEAVLAKMNKEDIETEMEPIVKLLQMASGTTTQPRLFL